MELSDIITYGIIAIAVLFLGPKVLNRGRGGVGNSPLNPPANDPGSRPGNDPGGTPGTGGGVFPGIGGAREEPRAPTNSPDTEGGFADRVEGDRPEKST